MHERRKRSGHRLLFHFSCLKCRWRCCSQISSTFCSPSLPCSCSGRVYLSMLHSCLCRCSSLCLERFPSTLGMQPQGGRISGWSWGHHEVCLLYCTNLPRSWEEPELTVRLDTFLEFECSVCHLTYAELKEPKILSKVKGKLRFWKLLGIWADCRRFFVGDFILMVKWMGGFSSAHRWSTCRVDLPRNI